MTKTKPRRHAGGRPAAGQMAQFQVRLPAEWMPALDMSARAQGMTRSGLVRWIVGRHLKGPGAEAGSIDEKAPNPIGKGASLRSILD